MEDKTPEVPAVVGEATSTVSDSRGPSGLGGWLVIVAIGVVITPFHLAYGILQAYPGIFRDGTWTALTDPVSPSYHPLWAPVLLTEITINVIFFAVSVLLLILFFRRSWRFPKLYIVFLASHLAFAIADSFSMSIVLPQQPADVLEMARDNFKSFVATMIWIPYMMVSRRVKNTFQRAGVESRDASIER